MRTWKLAVSVLYLTPLNALYFCAHNRANVKIRELSRQRMKVLIYERIGRESSDRYLVEDVKMVDLDCGDGMLGNLERHLCALDEYWVS